MMSKKRCDALWLRERFDWMGEHSGYDQLCRAIADLQAGTYAQVWRRPERQFPRGVRRLLWQIGKKPLVNPSYDLSSIYAEMNVLLTMFVHRPRLIHLMYVENQLGILGEWKKRIPAKLVGTIHYPSGIWRIMNPAPESVSALDALIVLGKDEQSYFEQYLPGRVYVVPHGVDTDFFIPAAETVVSQKQEAAPRCLFSGKWLRDLYTLACIVDKLIEKVPGIYIDMVVPRDIRSDPNFFRIARHSKTCWYAGISDEQLRQIYQKATVFLLPLINCTANNALLEAVSCGLPIVSNDVGTIRDYTSTSFADLLPVGDIDGMVNAALRLIEDRREQQQRSLAARAFAEQQLNWRKIAVQTLEVYDCVGASR